MQSASTSPGPLSCAVHDGVRTVLRHALRVSLVVFLVAVPLSLGITVVSGAPVMAGLIAAVVGGIVAGLLGGSPLQVSGPAAGLTVVVADLIAPSGGTTGPKNLVRVLAATIDSSCRWPQRHPEARA
jgi:carbonic anhydrase